MVIQKQIYGPGKVTYFVKSAPLSPHTLAIHTGWDWTPSVSTWSESLSTHVSVETTRQAVADLLRKLRSKSR